MKWDLAVMKPDKIRNKDDICKTMSLSVECPRHTNHPQRRASPHRNRWKPGGLVCGIHELERGDCQERACQWNEQGDTGLQTKHRSVSWDCRASLSFKRMRTASMLIVSHRKHRREISSALPAPVPLPVKPSTELLY
jgi:hypothetical protein